MNIRSRVAIAGVVVACTLFAGAGGAWAAITPISKILPDQQFVGLVNGKTQDATINMACFGPVQPLRWATRSPASGRRY
jgi:hypothetical protein